MNIGITSTAAARRGAEVRQLQAKIERTEREVQRLAGGMNSHGQRSDYLAEQEAWFRGELDRLRGELAYIEGLDGQALIDKYDPRIELPEPVSLRDALGRGEYGPGQVVVSRTHPPVRREGGDPAPAYR